MQRSTRSLYGQEAMPGDGVVFNGGFQGHDRIFSPHSKDGMLNQYYLKRKNAVIPYLFQVNIRNLNLNCGI